MSPEQAKGFATDHRGDVFSFGSVLYEMLTGRQAFLARPPPDVLASIVAREADLTALPADLNPRLVDLLRRCLEKNPSDAGRQSVIFVAEIETIAAAPRAIAMWHLPLSRPAAAAGETIAPFHGDRHDCRRSRCNRRGIAWSSGRLCSATDHQILVHAPRWSATCVDRITQWPRSRRMERSWSTRQIEGLYLGRCRN